MKSKTGIDETSCRAGIEIQMQRMVMWTHRKKERVGQIKRVTSMEIKETIPGTIVKKKKERIKYLEINLPKSQRKVMPKNAQTTADFTHLTRQ